MITASSAKSKDTALHFQSNLTIICRREEFFAALKKVFYDTVNENLPIYGVPVGKLKDYSTSKKDMKRGVEIVPEDNYRIRGEDKYVPKKDGPASDSSSFGSKGGSTSSTASTASTTISVGGESFGDDYHPEHGFRDASQTLYAKKGDKKVTL